jgi:dTDP-4-dehydrorhamnose 3,5-epimerase
LIFKELKLKGIFKIQLEKIEDERGFFARCWDKNEFEKYGLNTNIIQCNISFNKNKGTLRGLHYQTFPYEEAKLIRCTRGKIYEVMLDLRKESKTYKQWESIELSPSDYSLLYVPEGFALGFQTLEDNTELFYQMSEQYVPEFARGINYKDPKFNIDWPLEVQTISKRDSSFELFKE